MLAVTAALAIFGALGRAAALGAFGEGAGVGVGEALAVALGGGVALAVGLAFGTAGVGAAMVPRSPAFFAPGLPWLARFTVPGGIAALRFAAGVGAGSPKSQRKRRKPRLGAGVGVACALAEGAAFGFLLAGAGVALADGLAVAGVALAAASLLGAVAVAAETCKMAGTRLINKIASSFFMGVVLTIKRFVKEQGEHRINLLEGGRGAFSRGKW